MMLLCGFLDWITFASNGCHYTYGLDCNITSQQGLADPVRVTVSCKSDMQVKMHSRALVLTAMKFVRLELSLSL